MFGHVYSILKFRLAAAAGLLAVIGLLGLPGAAEAQRLSLGDLLDRIEALEGDGTGVRIIEVFNARNDQSCELPDGRVPDTIDIRGVHFDRAEDAAGNFPDPIVALGDFGQLTLCPDDPANPTATRIKAALPAGVEPGDYQVVISVGSAIGDTAEHLHTIGRGVRVEAFTVSTGTSCTYSCSDLEEFGKCETNDCPTFGDCICSKTIRARCSVSTCLAAPAETVTCPNVGGAQGQSQLHSCPLGTKAANASHTCEGQVPIVPLSGPRAECDTGEVTKSCNCGINRNPPVTGAAECECNIPGEVSCTSETKRSDPTLNVTALCLKAVTN